MVAPFWCCCSPPIEPVECLYVGWFFRRFGCRSEIDESFFACCYAKNSIARIEVRTLNIPFGGFGGYGGIKTTWPSGILSASFIPAQFRTPPAYRSDERIQIVYEWYIDSPVGSPPTVVERGTIEANVQYVLAVRPFVGLYEIAIVSRTTLVGDPIPEGELYQIATLEFVGTRECWQGTQSASCDSMSRNLVEVSEPGYSIRPFEARQDFDVTIDDNPCCRGPAGDCIGSGVAKNSSGYCCPVTAFETLVLEVDTAPTVCTDCLDFIGVEDGKYTTVPSLTGTFYLSKVGSPPVGIDHQWQYKTTGVVGWSDATSFNRSCASLTERNSPLGDVVYQVSITGDIVTIEILLDILDDGPGSPPAGVFTDTIFRRSFTYPSDCSIPFGGVFGNELTTSNWDCVTTELDPSLDLDLGHGGSVTLGVAT